jgi:hypothetical protein
MSIDRFLGRWTLDPTGSDYQVGEPPMTATYRIEGDEETLAFHVEYGVEGMAMAFTYVTHPDGEAHGYDDVNGVIDELKTTLIDDNTLETTSWSNGVEVAHAVRIVSDDGQSMKIVQSGVAADGRRFTNVSVYRKGGS